MDLIDAIERFRAEIPKWTEPQARRALRYLQRDFSGAAFAHIDD